MSPFSTMRQNSTSLTEAASHTHLMQTVLHVLELGAASQFQFCQHMPA